MHIITPKEARRFIRQRARDREASYPSLRRRAQRARAARVIWIVIAAAGALALVHHLSGVVW